ncbi:hypothetical protein SAMN05444397_102366 [Flavobacterium aquidurense]|uniref:Uncharacterized protein n=1 Tax=Flavobacterium frigidimaris TaxID=262320 RepID=A0ABX4BRC3_FLAFR|nr:hypothetical protein [Flavobacterium frigidimaris]OXA79125.1 hypothetical protein B0A65_11300 [Flavobacterium frigidimaris]SDY83119.1 hypothetical protein SAMN05444397_102366 [Flavobacterium aquidurense]
MYNITSEEYKKAIKAKYEIEKSGDYSNFLMSPTQANLRKLCWERFKENTSKDDLNAFQSFFDFEFSVTRKNQLKEQTDKLKPIRAFFIGKTESPTDETIDFAAILVDYKLRPYRKFEKETIIKTKQSIDNSFDSEIVSEDEKRQLDTFFEDQGEKSIGQNEEMEKSSRKNKLLEKLFNKSKPAMITVGVLFCLIAVIIYFAFIKKNCMQWSEDHYEIVDCSIKPKPDLNIVIPLNKDLLDFRKVKVCDTTNCFNKNGNAFIWYSKSNNIVEFFNTHGNHPINHKPLRAVTPYIFKKYSEDCVPQK